MMTEPTVKIQIDDAGVAVVTLFRPEFANALNSQMALELKDIFYNLPQNVRLVILTGAGERAFCAGADLKERQNINIEAWQIQHSQFRFALQTILDCHVPVIAAINGAAYGGGLEIALACDFIYAADTAKFALPEVTLGIMPGMGGTQHLPAALGLRRAKELLYTGSYGVGYG
jgi:enoyl-CoA hydratase/carnithine racemase